MYLEAKLTAALEKNIESELDRQASSLNQLISLIHKENLEKKINPALNKIKKQNQIRITLIHKNGQVFADSNLPYNKIKSLDNHGNRPEIILAKTHKTGVSRRYSQTIKLISFI